MYQSGNLQNNASGERHSSYQHYSMSQVNNEQPVVHREHEEQSQTWGQPPPSSSSMVSPSQTYYPNNFDGNQNFTSKSHLASSSSSLFDRNYSNTPDNSNYQQQSYTNQYRSLGHPSFSQTNTGAYQQQANLASSSSYSRISSNATTSQAHSGAQHIHNVPYFHGFKFQALPGLLLFNALCFR